MEEISSLYNSQTKCPVCESKMEFTKVRTKSVRLLRQDSDFCPYYEGENPILYEAVICPECGYGAHVTTFENINKYEKTKVREKITPKWNKRIFLGHRSNDKALESFKIVLLNLCEREAIKSEIARICMRIAWIYRYNDEKEYEKKFLEHTLNYYMMAYHEEDLSQGKLDEYTCMFIIGELSKRLELFEQSTQWFSRLIMCYSDPRQKSKIPHKLIETTRDIVQEIKEIMAAKKEEAL